MVRYFLTPLAIIAICYEFLPICAQAMTLLAAATQYIQASPIPTFDSLVLERAALEVFNISTVPTQFAGIFLSGAFIAGDLYKNEPFDRSGLKSFVRLILNFAWCSLYALLANACNGLVFVGFVTMNAAATKQLLAKPLSLVCGVTIASINLTALLVAITCTVNAREILTPLVLLRKLRRSLSLRAAR